MASRVGDVFADLVQAFGALGVRWYLFGAQAAIVHGSARLSADVDVTVELGDRDPGELVEALRAVGVELAIPADDAFVAAARVLPMVHGATAMPVDVVLAGSGLEALFLDRAQLRRVDGVDLPVATPEDIVVMKLFAGRSDDVQDAKAVVAANPAIDLDHVRELIAAIEEAMDQSDLAPRLEDVVRAARRRR